MALTNSRRYPLRFKLYRYLDLRPAAGAFTRRRVLIDPSALDLFDREAICHAYL